MSRWSSPETAAAVLAYLREHADDQGQVAASFPTLGRALHVGQNTAYRAVARLIAAGDLTVVRMGTGGRYPSRYRVTARDHEPVSPHLLAG